MFYDFHGMEIDYFSTAEGQVLRSGRTSVSDALFAVCSRVCFPEFLMICLQYTFRLDAIINKQVFIYFFPD